MKIRFQWNDDDDGYCVGCEWRGNRSQVNIYEKIAKKKRPETKFDLFSYVDVVDDDQKVRRGEWMKRFVSFDSETGKFIEK